MPSGDNLGVDGRWRMVGSCRIRLPDVPFVIDDTHAWMGSQVGGLCGEFAREPAVVGIEKAYELASGLSQAGVARGGYTTIRLADDPDIAADFVAPGRRFRQSIHHQ